MTLHNGEPMEMHPYKSLVLYPQQGSVLVVSLLILLVMTLLGVTAMTTSRLEEKMAINTRQYNLAFQASESALRDGEADLTTNAPQNFSTTCGGGLCLPATNGNPAWVSTSWTSGANARRYGQYTGTPALTEIPTTPTNFQPLYIIEKLPLQPTQGNGISQLGNYGSNIPIQYYRVTSYGSGADGTGAVMLQSVFRP